MPNYYAQLNKDKRVVCLSQLSGEVQSERLIPIDEELYNNHNLLLMRYIDGDFVGTVALMEADKPAIAADGEDTLTVQITVTDWQGKVAKDFDDEIALEMNGMSQSVKASKGTAEITISSEEPGEYILRTTNLDRNAEWKVVVQHGIEKTVV